MTKTSISTRLSLVFLVLFIISGCAPDRSGRSVPETTMKTPTREVTMSDAALADELADGGEVVYVRHSPTNTLEVDEDKGDLARCSTQRNLSRQGREQAQEIGEAFIQLELPVGEVLASPYCRTRQTAELAFGEENVRTTRDLLSPQYVPRSEAARVQDYESKLGSLLSTPPEGETNTVPNTLLIGHESVLRTVTGESVLEGGAVVFDPLGDGEYQVLGTIGPDDWRTLRK